ncbi:MAG: hypothetical protein GY906_27860 [bacterium]|nr:hypothetical protein [bacterium]
MSTEEGVYAMFVGGGPWDKQWHYLPFQYGNYFVLWPASLPGLLPSIEELKATEYMDLSPKAEYRLTPTQPPLDLGVSPFFLAECVAGCEDPNA